MIVQEIVKRLKILCWIMSEIVDLKKDLKMCQKCLKYQKLMKL